MSRKIRWRKLGGGTFRMANGKIIKTNQIFEAKPEEIPLAFRDVIVPLDPLPKEPSILLTSLVYKLRHLKGLWNTICDAIKKIWHDPVWSKIIAWGIIGLIVMAGAYIYNIYKSVPGLKDIENNSVVVAKKITPDNIIAKGKLPFLKNLLILDNTIYMKHYYNNFVIGGKNLGKIKIAARTYEGTSAKLQFNEFPAEISLRISDKPYIEIEYKNNYYSIEVTKHSKSYFYKYKLKKIPNLTMDLEPLSLIK